MTNALCGAGEVGEFSLEELAEAVARDLSRDPGGNALLPSSPSARDHGAPDPHALRAEPVLRQTDRSRAACDFLIASALIAGNPGRLVPDSRGVRAFEPSLPPPPAAFSSGRSGGREGEKGRIPFLLAAPAGEQEKRARPDVAMWRAAGRSGALALTGTGGDGRGRGEPPREWAELWLKAVERTGHGAGTCGP